MANNNYKAYSKRELEKFDKGNLSQKEAMPQKQRSFDEMWREGKQKEQQEQQLKKKQALEERKRQLTQRKQQQLERQKLKAEIAQLKRETSVTGKFQSAYEKIREQQQKIKSRQAKKPAVTKSKYVSSKGEQYLVIDGVLYKKMGNDVQIVGGKKATAKASKPKKEPNPLTDSFMEW